MNNLIHRKARIADLPRLIELLLEDELGSTRESKLRMNLPTSCRIQVLYCRGRIRVRRPQVNKKLTLPLLSFDVTMTSQVLRALGKRGLLNRSQKEGDECSKFSELTDAGSAKIQGAAKDLLKAEESFFKSLGENKKGFDEHLRGILQQQIEDMA